MTALDEPGSNHVLSGIVHDFDDVWQPSASKFSHVTVTVTITSSNQDTTVALRVDGTGDPSVEACSVRNASAIIIGLVPVPVTSQFVLSADVPAGQNVKIAKTGNAQASIDNIQVTVYQNNP